MREVLTMEDYISNRAERFRYMQDGYVIGRGFNYCTALEASLKLAETCYVGMLGYSAADFLHGPIAAVHENEACFLCAPPGKTIEGIKDIAVRLRDRKAETVILSSEDEVLDLATTPFKIPAKIEEELSPLLYILPGQMLAYYLANAKGYDPDRPRGLSKVTLTM
jgi:glucosamine--fructose-6-phosphate aminotransferase (isomerizing)